MGEIKDFNCTYDNSAGINGEVTEGLGLTFPDAYLHADTMAKLSRALKEHYGNDKTGPRAKEYICTKPEELLELQPIDFSKGRIHEVLQACRMLREQGEHVVLQVSGPFTILNVLIDARYVFKAMRKQPEVMKEVFWKLGNEVLRFMEEAKKYGVDLISYADSSGGVNILGPKMAEQVVEDFTYEFLKQVEGLADEHTMILLCPKTTFALLGTGHGKLKDHLTEAGIRYGEACIRMTGKAKFAGQMCIKNVGYELENGIFKELVLI